MLELLESDFIDIKVTFHLLDEPNYVMQRFQKLIINLAYVDVVLAIINFWRSIPGKSIGLHYVFLVPKDYESGY